MSAARKGQCFAFAVERRITALHGPTTISTLWRLAEAVRVNCNGVVMAFRTLGTKDQHKAAIGNFRMIPATVKKADLEAAYGDLGYVHEFDSLDEVRGFVRPFMPESQS